MGRLSQESVAGASGAPPGPPGPSGIAWPSHTHCFYSQEPAVGLWLEDCHQAPKDHLAHVQEGLEVPGIEVRVLPHLTPDWITLRRVPWLGVAPKLPSGRLCWVPLPWWLSFWPALLPWSLTHFYCEHLLMDGFTGIHIAGAASEEPLPSHRGQEILSHLSWRAHFLLSYWLFMIRAYLTVCKWMEMCGKIWRVHYGDCSSVGLWWRLSHLNFNQIIRDFPCSWAADDVWVSKVLKLRSSSWIFLDPQGILRIDLVWYWEPNHDIFNMWCSVFSAVINISGIFY